MGDPAAFTDPENWSGGFYELAVEISDTDDARLDRAIAAVWPAARVAGCYADRSRAPHNQ
jgi:hypothetical protein